MTIERQDIKEDFYEADRKDIQFTIKTQLGALKDLTGSEIVYSLFKDDGKNPQVIFQKSSINPSEIEVVGLGVCVVHLLPGDTIHVYGTFRHQLYVMDIDGYGEIVSSGKVEIFRSFARRPRNTSTPAYLNGTTL